MSDTPADDTSHYEGALLEEIRDQQKAILEAVGGLPGDVRRLKADIGTLQEDLTGLKVNVAALHEDVTDLKGNVAVLQGDMNDVRADLTVIKPAVVAQSTDLDDHEHRITHLERKAA